MKKLISLCLASFLLTVVTFGQEATTATSVDGVKKATCVPTKECAEKMGMTLEQCKALCKKHADKTAADAPAESNAQTVAMTGNKKGKKACCSSIEACAKKMGMTVEECKARCQKSCSPGAKTASTASVASAVMVSSKAAPKDEKTAKASCAKKCSKKEKAACKKMQ